MVWSILIIEYKLCYGGKIPVLSQCLDWNNLHVYTLQLVTQFQLTIYYNTHECHCYLIRLLKNNSKPTLKSTSDNIVKG